MADKETGLNIPVNAVANKDSAKEAANELTKNVLSSLKDGYIEIPVELRTPIRGASKNLNKAQKDVIKQWEKTFKEGFSSSEEDLDDLVKTYQKFKRLAGQERKAGTKQSRGISAIMGGPIQEYTASKREAQVRRNEFKKEFAKAQKRNTKQTARDRYLDQQEQYSKRAQGAGKRAELRKELDYVRENKSNVPSSSNIKESMVNEHEMKLSRYSSYGSNWARDLAKTLKIEEARAAKTLKKWFDEDYEIGTEVGEKSGKIISKKTGKPTTEAQMIADVYKNVKQTLTDTVRKSEAGDETITADTFTELAAIMKILNKTLMTELSGKSLEEATSKTAADIANALLRPYSISERDPMGFTDLEEGQEKGVGIGHENTQKELREFQKRLESWNSDIYQTITNGMNQLNETLETVRTSESYRNELERLNNTMEASLNAIKDSTKELQGVNRSVKIGNTKEAVEDDAAEKISKENRDINRDVARAVKRDANTGFNTDTLANEQVNATENIRGLMNDIIQLPEKQENLYKSLQGGNKLTLPEPKEGSLQFSKGVTPESTIKKSLSLIPVPNISKALAVIPGEFAKTLKESIHPTKSDFQNYMKEYNQKQRMREDSEISKRAKSYDDRMRRLADEKNTRQDTDRKTRERQYSSRDVITPGDEPSSRVEKSKIYASPVNMTIWDKFESAIERITGRTKEYEQIIKSTAEEQDQMAAERIKTYGLNNGRNPNDTGDIAGMRRILQLYRTNKESIESNPELMQKIRLTPGREVDTSEITKALNEALSGKNMRNAQMGGSIPRQILGGLTGFIGMPSLEKSRAQADGLNQVLGNINNALQSVLINIQMKETELAGMEKTGQAKFTEEGYLTSDSSSAAFKTLADLEEEKLVLDSIKADLLANDEIIEKTGGKFSKLAKQMSFTSPVLRENNGILRNIISGLDKNGKALKFQTRMAEILNYTFQLMSRSIGQMIKNWLSMINPLNLIKQRFDDFASYDPKWQRTMNVIKNNFREIILPFMQKIAQTLVNIIGFLDIISMKIQEAFGYTPISLFDQKNANDFKKTYEEISNITAGFDELHDIGSSGGENDPDNLLGEIYKPQLSQGWIDLANKIGDLFAGVIKGDLGFGEAMVTILKLLGETLATIGKMLWDWFKETDVGKWLIENWKTALATILGLFLTWKLLKIFGPTLLSTIGNAFKTLLSKVGGWITTLLGASGFGQGIMLAFQSLFAGGKYSLIGTLKEMFTNSAAITQAGSWGSMIGFALAKGLIGTLSIALGIKGLTDAFDSAADKSSYNIGLEQSGGNKEDRQSAGWDILKGTGSGAAIGFGIGQIIPIVGPAIGAAIGAVAGVLTTSLAPAFEKVAVSAKEANNEMQKIEHYEGQVQGYSTQVSQLEELQQILNDTLQEQTDKVYAEGEQLGITKTRMDELIVAVQNGTFQTSMLSGAEVGLTDSLIQLSAEQVKNKEATERLEAAKLKLQKAELDLAIAEDVAAGNFEMAAARINYAEAASLYTTEEATAKRIQLYKQAGNEEAAALLQDLTPQQREKMANINKMTEDELASFVETWKNSSDEVKKAFLSGIDSDTQTEFANQMNSIDSIIEEHTGFWQTVGDTLKEIFTFGIADTWTYNGEKKATAEYKSRVIPSAAVGMNYVPNDGLIYVHQGEAIIPKKYNQPYQPNNVDQSYIDQIITTMRALDTTIQQGITVKGEFKQKGTDLVATVKKVENRNGNQPLNNPVFAR